MTDQKENHAISNARAWAEEIERMADAVCDFDATDEAREEAEREIWESPLSVRVRDDWRAPHEEERGKPVEYEILLSTGGPAFRMIGELGEHGEPENARLQWQDWGTPWTDYRETTDKQDDALLVFASRCVGF